MNSLTLLKIYFRSKQENNEEANNEEEKDKKGQEVDDKYVWILEKGIIIFEYLKF